MTSNVIVLPPIGMDMKDMILPLPTHDTLKMNAEFQPAAAETQKMKTKRGAKSKAPKPRRAEKKMKTAKPKIPKQKPAAAGKMKEKHAHAHHPPWADMMVAAVKALNEKHGSSMPAIKKYILSTYNIDTGPEKVTPMLRRGLKAATASNKLTHVKGKGLAGSFRIPKSGAKLGMNKKMKKRANLKGKMTKKAPKGTGKKIVKKEKKLIKKPTGAEKAKPKKVEMAPTLAEGKIPMLISAPLAPAVQKIKKTKKPKTEMKTKKTAKAKKTPMKVKSAKSPKSRMAPKPKITGAPTAAVINITPTTPLLTAI